MNEPTDWTSALAILVAGLALGALFIYFFGKRKTKTIGDETDLVRKDLEAKRDALIQQLRDLDENASPEERSRLELDTADVLRTLDRWKGTSPASSTAPATVEMGVASRGSGMSPAVRGFLWGAGSFAALAGMFYLVMQTSTQRQEGGSLTGDIPVAQQGMQQQQQPDPIVQQLEAAVQKDPENLVLRNDLAQAYLERENMMAVFEHTKFVLDRKPEDSRALTYAALVRMAMGEGDEARKMLERASKSDPKNLDTWVSLAWMHAQKNEMKEAEAMIAEAAKQVPNEKARLDMVFGQMKQALTEPQQPVQTAAANGELPPGHPPIDGAPAPAAAPAPAGAMRPAAPDGPSINVTLDLDPLAKSKTGVLYVIARNPAGGPPVAVKRLGGGSFPMTFTLGSADSMMGQPLPAKFRLEARLDSDGDAATKPPTDPAAMANDVTPGATVKLTLK